jgi:NADH-quinone oxidoreductase subunit D
MNQSDSDTTTTLDTAAETPTGAKRRIMTLNMGPQHPSTHGVLRVVLQLDGETVVQARPDIGYLHTGIEKQCEALNWAQITPLTDRVDYLANLINNTVYALAVEKLLGLEIPKPAQYMRVLLNEMQRINSHVVWLGTHAMDIGAMTMFFYCFREREDILKIFEFFSGQRLMTSYIRIGGLALEPPRGWQKMVRKFIDAFPSHVDEYETILNANPIWVRRTKDVGIAPVEDLLDQGVTGPMIRAAGIPWDIRKSEPYSSYEEFDFDIAVESGNDVWSRYRVRMKELRQSARIVQQALDKLGAYPDGPWKTDEQHAVLPDREKMKTQMEALIYHFKIVTEGIRVPAGETYTVVESPRGELGYYIVSDGTSKPHRLFMRTPSFGNLQALPELVENRLIADTIAALGSMDFVLGDTDR